MIARYIIALLIALQVPSASAEGRVTLHRETLQRLILKELTAQGIDEHMQLYFLSSPQFELVDTPQVAEVKLASLNADQRSSKFDGMVETQGQQLKILGRYEEIIQVPTLTRRYNKGEAIQAVDITAIDYSKRLLSRDALLTEQAIVGKAVTRTILRGKPLMISDINEPEAVKQNTLVNLVYRTSNLEITATGTALKAGALGASIPVKNVRSGVTVQGRVTGENMVLVGAQPEFSLGTKGAAHAQ